MDSSHYDQKDPIFHDRQGQFAVDAILARHHKWLSMQDEDTQARYCEHGRYVGYQAALSYRCPGCVGRDESADESA